MKNGIAIGVLGGTGKEDGGLAFRWGLSAWHAGPLANSVAAEALSSVLIAINKRHKVPGAGVRITGVPLD